MLPNPAKTLYYYMRYEVDRTHVAPHYYRPLEQRRKREHWPEAMADWPSRIDVMAIKHYPPAAPAAPVREGRDVSQGGGSAGGAWGSGAQQMAQQAMGTNSYFMLLALRPQQGSTFSAWVGDHGWVI